MSFTGRIEEEIPLNTLGIMESRTSITSPVRKKKKRDPFPASNWDVAAIIITRPTTYQPNPAV